MKLLKTSYLFWKTNLASLFILLLTTFSTTVFSQELNCNVIVDATQVQTQEKQIFEDLQTSIYEFMNNRSWTGHEYQPEEKINCNLIINVTGISSPAGGVLTATAQIQSSRPIFNTDYETVLFNYADKNFSFDYQQSQDLFYNENSFVSNLTSLLAFYAYTIIGYDYDSFSMLGGTDYFNKAREIVNNAQQSPFKGWQAFQDINNRYWLVDDILNLQFEPFRKGLYNHHRIVLDTFTDPSKRIPSFQSTIKMLEGFQRIRNIKPTSIVMNTYFNSKGDEFVNIFKGADQATKLKAYTTLLKLDPSNADVYKKITQ